MNCTDHLSFTGEVCPDCNLPVDVYGNTEAQFTFCCFPDCGCDGERLCMAPNGASSRACKSNVEGMWSGNSRAQRKARMDLLSDVLKESP